MYDSAAVFFKWKQKINAVRECSLFGINFDTLNTTTRLYAHTFPIYHSCVSDTWWHNKMLQCQIFIAQTALVQHPGSEIPISYVYVHLVVIWLMIRTLQRNEVSTINRVIFAVSYYFCQLPMVISQQNKS